MERVEEFKSIQGEGPFSGQEAWFIRFARCNLSCPWCDTKDANRKTTYQKVTPEYYQHLYDTELIIITGGEPLIQPEEELKSLLLYLLAHNYTVQLETNGTKWFDWIPDEVHVVCSPKLYLREHNLEVLKKIGARKNSYFKFVIEGSDPGHLAAHIRKNIDVYLPEKPIYIMAEGVDPTATMEATKILSSRLIQYKYIPRKYIIQLRLQIYLTIK